MKRLFIFIFLITFVFADDVYLKDGGVIYGCKTKMDSSGVVIITYNHNDRLYEKRYPYSSIDKILTEDISLSEETIWTKNGKQFNPLPLPSSEIQNNQQSSDDFKIQYNYKSFPVTILALGLGFGFSQEARDLDRKIDDEEHYSSDQRHDFKEQYERKNFLKITCYSVAIVNVLFGFELIDIRTNAAGLDVSVRF